MIVYGLVMPDLHIHFMWTVYCQYAVELTRAAAISVIYRMVGGGDFFRPVTVMWRFCTNNKVSQGAAGDFFNLFTILF